VTPRYLLDTNICIFLKNNRHPNVARKLAELKPGDVAMSVVTWGELVLGAEKSRERSQTLAKITKQKAYIHLGPQFATVSRQAVKDAVRACRARGDAQWLLILGFAFESDVENSLQTQRAGSFRVDKVRMHDDLLQAGLTKKDKKAATFVTIGEPDIALERDGDAVRVEIRGLDLYDPIRDEVRARSVADIAYWMVDDDYDGASFMVRQVFFCGGDKDEFDKWKRGLSDLAKTRTRKKLENTLKIEIDSEAFDRLYGFVSHPISFRAGKRVAVRVVSQFGEESTKILRL
jgi:adenine-specific DNA-methyltransferase